MGTIEYNADDDQTYVYPAAYGAYCRAWDANGTGPDCDDPDNLGSFCLREWCYVDPSCTLSDTAQSLVNP